MSSTEPGITVIGGGVIGLACAHRLQRAGLTVELIDAGPPQIKCSFGNAGSISSGSVAPLALPGVLAKVPSMLLDPGGPLRVRPGYVLRALPWLWQFVRAARRDRVERIADALSALLAPAVQTTRALAEDCGAGDLVRDTGQLQLYPSRKALEADGAVWRLRRERGVEFVEVDAGQIRDLEPAVGSAYPVGIYLPNEAMAADPWQLCECIAADFRARGGTILHGRVHGFGMRDGRPHRLRLEDGSERALSQVVIAAGAWSGQLTSQIGHPVPLESQRGYHLSLAGASVKLGRPVVMADRKCFVTPMQGALRLAGTVEFGGLDAPPNRARARRLLDHARHLLPGLEHGAVDEWMGHRPCLPDSLPVIGRSRRHSNVLFAFGHGHLGLTGAAVTAEQVARLATGAPATIDLAPFDIERFPGR